MIKGEMNLVVINNPRRKRRGIRPLEIKVLAVPIKIESSTDQETNQSYILYNHVAGLCFGGNTSQALMVKERICDALGNLQSLHNENEINFERIAELSLELYRYSHQRITKDIPCENAKDVFSVHFLLGGYCPVKKKIRVFLFFIDNQNPQKKEVLIEKPYEAIGSGKRKFESLIIPYLTNIDQIDRQVFLRIKDVINDPDIYEVAGTVQCGEFDVFTRSDFINRAVQYW
jgi:hypothetical protein